MARERRANDQQVAIEIRTQAGMRGGGAATWARSIHLQFFMAGFAEGTQRIGGSVADRLSDPGKRSVLVGISVDDIRIALSASAMTSGDDSTLIRLSVA
jgi:hypothetical protein